ncbi:MAG: hypothetical protein FWE16_01935 [Firmicutes bacterium]|nr:hypothetical protein [Bacillota bacterium]
MATKKEMKEESLDQKIAMLEALSKSLESEKSFEKSVQDFERAAVLVKEIMGAVADKKGRVTEIIKNIDATISEIPLDTMPSED